MSGLDPKPLGHGTPGNQVESSFRNSAGEIVTRQVEFDAERTRLEFAVTAIEARLRDAKEQLRRYVEGYAKR